MPKAICFIQLFMSFLSPSNNYKHKLSINQTRKSNLIWNKILYHKVNDTFNVKQNNPNRRIIFIAGDVLINLTEREYINYCSAWDKRMDRFLWILSVILKTVKMIILNFFYLTTLVTCITNVKYEKYFIKRSIKWVK